MGEKWNYEKNGWAGTVFARIQCTRIPNFQTHRTERIKKGGGTAILVKKWKETPAITQPSDEIQGTTGISLKFLKHELFVYCKMTCLLSN